LERKKPEGQAGWRGFGVARGWKDHIFHIDDGSGQNGGKEGEGTAVLQYFVKNFSYVKGKTGHEWTQRDKTSQEETILRKRKTKQDDAD